jgi:hypothetical protein
MSKFKKKKEEAEPKPERVWSKEEITTAIAEMDVEREKLKVTPENPQGAVRAELNWYRKRGAIRIYDDEKGTFGVILPMYTEMQSLREAVGRFEHKEKGIEMGKLKGLEQIASNMRVEDNNHNEIHDVF